VLLGHILVVLCADLESFRDPLAVIDGRVAFIDVIKDLIFLLIILLSLIAAY
jgi:hypothetical protein